MRKPVLAITMGDPAGVGPELCLECLGDAELAAHCTPVVLGDVDILRRAAKHAGIPVPPFRELTVDQVEELRQFPPTTGPEHAGTQATVVDFKSSFVEPVQPGVISAETGRASYHYIERAIAWALAGTVDGIVTCPIHKEAFAASGAKYPGHTEMLADLTGCDRYCMMLTSEEISCSLVTCHIGLSDVPAAISHDRIVEVIELTATAMERHHGRPAKVAVCGLNPHAGENGLFGNDEEGLVIGPAVEAARKRGLDVIGPLAPDTAFVPRQRAATDAFVCMYHDQGLIPLKALAFDSAINVTLGLPIVRSSVDHGTALDIAWQGRVDHSSLGFAVRWAAAQASNGGSSVSNP